MPGFKDEHLVIIAPGSHITHAQLGLPESFTPARLRLKTRMFSAETPGQYEPHRIRKKAPSKKPGAQAAQNGGDGDITMVNGAAEEEPTYEEDPDSDVGAIWPMEAGRISNWPCFFAFMEHVHKSLGANFHTPILIAAQPVWTPVEHVKLTRFIFEKFKCPAFALVDSAQALCYAYGVQTACVIDIGKDKADITAVADFLINDAGRAVAVPDLGGEAMTQNLMRELGDGFDREMCEQLKMNPICEILPAGVPVPGMANGPAAQLKSANPASAASTGADGSGAGQRHTAGATGDAPRGPATGSAVTGADEEADVEKEGVVDVAALVASGKLKEHLAKKEKERAAKAAARKKAKGAAAVAEELKNSDKEYVTFTFDDQASRERAKDAASEGAANAQANGALRLDTQQANGTSSVPSSAIPESAPQTAISTTAPSIPPTPTSPTSPSTFTDPNGAPTTTTKASKNPHARTLTVGPARFQSLSPSYLPLLSSHIHRAINAASPSPTVRQSLWDHILLTGSGARIRGFKEALLAHLNARYVVSPNSASIFTSEPPSSFGTPGGTGTNTPIPPMQGAVPGQMALPAFGGGGAGVNPLLYAATTASASQGQAQGGRFNRPPAQQNPSNLMPTPQRPLPVGSGQMQTPPPPLGQRPGMAPAGAGHSAQTPTSVKAGRLPEYFAEWKEEGSPYWAVFLGAQVAAKCLFLADDRGGTQKGFMSRSDYNEQGPQGITEFSL